MGYGGLVEDRGRRARFPRAGGCPINFFAIERTAAASRRLIWPARRTLDASSFIHLVSKRGHLEPSTGRDLPNHECPSPVDPYIHSYVNSRGTSSTRFGAAQEKSEAVHSGGAPATALVNRAYSALAASLLWTPNLR